MTLSNEGEWDALLDGSEKSPFLLFKHSPRCGTSAYVKERLETDPRVSDLPCHFLDVVRHRPLARKIADMLAERHESPQILLIHHRQCVWADDHMAIRPEEVRDEYDRCLAS